MKKEKVRLMKKIGRARVFFNPVLLDLNMISAI